MWNLTHQQRNEQQTQPNNSIEQTEWEHGANTRVKGVRELGVSGTGHALWWIHHATSAGGLDMLPAFAVGQGWISLRRRKACDAWDYFWTWNPHNIIGSIHRISYIFIHRISVSVLCADLDVCWSQPCWHVLWTSMEGNRKCAENIVWVWVASYRMEHQSEHTGWLWLWDVLKSWS